jgi:hypothetical protein
MRNFNDLSERDKGVALVRRNLTDIRNAYREHSRGYKGGYKDGLTEAIIFCSCFLQIETLGDIEIDYSNMQIPERE